LAETFNNIEKLEADLWEAADNLRANSKLTSSDYFMPVLGVIFLRHAANRFDAANRQIAADQASGKMPKRKVLPADYIARRSLFLPEKARYDWIMQQAAVSGADLTKIVTEALSATMFMLAITPARCGGAAGSSRAASGVPFTIAAIIPGSAIHFKMSLGCEQMIRIYLNPPSINGSPAMRTPKTNISRASGWSG
jgi:hypothetical protein